MRALNEHELQQVAGGGLIGDIAEFAVQEVRASVLGAVAAGSAGAIIGGRHGGDGGGLLGIRGIGQLVGLVSGGLIGLAAGAIGAPLIGWDDTVKYTESAIQGVINGTLG